jgi:hypothetical protein
MGDPLTVGRVAVQHTGWRRTGSSFLDGEPPHYDPYDSSHRVSMIWGDAQQTIPLAATDRDGCIAIVMDARHAALVKAADAVVQGGPQVTTPTTAAGKALLENIAATERLSLRGPRVAAYEPLIAAIEAEARAAVLDRLDVLHSIVCRVRPDGTQHAFVFDPQGILSDCRYLREFLAAAIARAYEDVDQ